jgi:hypothetical protein
MMVATKTATTGARLKATTSTWLVVDDVAVELADRELGSL